MATLDYQEFLDFANELLDTFGGIGKITRQGGDTISGRCVILDSDNERVDKEDGSVVSKTCLFEGSVKKPAPDDVLVFGKRTFTVVNVNDVTPDGITTVIFEMVVR